MIKKFFLALAIVSAFMVGYGVAAKAWPGVPDRARWHGYFKDQLQKWGDDVWVNGIPPWINDANSFIAFTEAKLSAGPDTQDGVGAAFIIQIMLGLDRSLPPTPDQIKTWEDNVRYADINGWILWNQWATFTVNSFYQPGPIDDAFYYETNTSNTIIFTDGAGNWLNSIRRECANPVGTPNPIPQAPHYAISGRTTVSQPTAIPGQAVTFSSFLNNSGPDFASNINWHTHINTNVGPIAQQGTNSFGPGEIDVADELFTIPPDAPFWTTYCRMIHFSPSVNGSGSVEGAPACVQVVPQYSLQPIATPSTPTAQQNDTITFTYTVNNSGPTISENVNCYVVGNIRPAGYTPLPQQDTDRTSDPGYVPPSPNCPAVFPIGLTIVATESVNVGNLAPGQQICRSLVVNPRDQNGGPRASAEACVVIAKTPYAHFMGNDVWAGGGFDGPGNPPCNATSKIQTVAPHQLSDGTVAGSLTEYGAFALGAITNFGSASKALFPPAGTALTFSNLDNNNLGNFGAPTHCINNYISTYDPTPVDSPPLPGAVDVGSQGNGTWHLSGDRSFSGTLPAGGTQQIYLVDGSVTISDDLKYPASYSSINDVPSLVIIAKGGINVMGNVAQMDGVFVTTGVFHTCDQHIGTLTVSTCNNQLVINGAVITNQLNLRRTYGADGNDDTARKQPAERFNFNAEVYLRNVLNGVNSGVTLQTIDQKDLPPRY